MTCLSSEELAAVLDGAAPRNKVDVFREHLARCPRCANEISRLSQDLGGIQPEVEVSADLLLRVKNLVKAQTRAEAQLPLPRTDNSELQKNR